MKVLLLSALACLVSATEEPLPFSGNFSTIYLASNHLPLIEENSQVRLLMREVKFFNNYKLLSMTFYVRINGTCQLHTVWANKASFNICPRRSLASSILNCVLDNMHKLFLGTWVLRDANLHFPQIYNKPAYMGGRTTQPSKFYISLNFVSNTTILLNVNFRNRLGYTEVLTAALAKGTDLTEEMWTKYVKLTKVYEVLLKILKISIKQIHALNGSIDPVSRNVLFDILDSLELNFEVDSIM